MLAGLVLLVSVMLAGSLVAAPPSEGTVPTALPASAPPSASASTEQHCNAALLQRIQTNYLALAGFETAFEQQDERTDGQILLARGTLSYLRPGRMRWVYEPPQEQLVVIDGEKVWVYDPLLENVTVQPLAALAPGTPLAFLLGEGDFLRDFGCHPQKPLEVLPEQQLDLERQLNSERRPGPGRLRVALRPESDIPGVDTLTLTVRGEDLQLQAVELLDEEGNRRTLNLITLLPRQNFPEQHFRFVPPEGVEIIEGS